MTDLALSLKLSADGSGLVGTLRVSKQELDRLKQGFNQSGDAADKLDGKTKKADASLKGMNLTIGKLWRSVTSLRTGVASLIAGMGIREIYQTTRSWEGYAAALKAVTGSNAGARAEMGFVSREAKRLGLEIDALLPSYTKLAASAKGTELEGQATRDIFIAVAEASKVMNLSAQDTEGALNAIQQMMSKGNVQAEELRGQLGERIPGAFQLAARAMDVTTQELNKMLDNGEVLAVDLLPNLAKVLREQYTFNVKDAAEQTGTSAAYMSNAWDKFLRGMSAAGVGAIIKGGFDLMGDFFNWAADAAIKVSGQIQIAWLKINQVFDVVVALVSTAWNHLMNLLREGAASLTESFAKLVSWVPGMRGLSEQMLKDAQSMRETKTEVKPLSEALYELNTSYEKQFEAINANTAAKIAMLNIDREIAAQEHDTILSVKEFYENTNKLSEAQEKLLEKLLPSRAAMKDYSDALKELEKISDPDLYFAARFALEEELEKSLSEKPAKAAKKGAVKTFDVYKNLVTGVQGLFADTFNDVWENGLSGFEDFGKRVFNMFTGLLSQMAAASLTAQLFPSAAGGLAGAASLNPWVAGGVLVGGLALGALFGGNDERRQRNSEARGIRSALNDDLGSALRILRGESTEAAEELRKLNREISEAYGRTARGDVLDRAKAERELFDLMQQRYRMEKQLIEGMISKTQSIIDRVSGVRASIDKDILALSGQNDYRGAADIKASVSGISSLDLGWLAESIDLYRELPKAQQRYDTALANLTKSQRSGGSSGFFYYEESPEARSAFDQAESNLKSIQDQYALVFGEGGFFEQQFNLFVEDAEHGVAGLEALREETWRWYNAQLEIINGLKSASADLGATLTSLRRSQLTPAARVQDLFSEFNSVAALARGANDLDLANYAGRLNTLASPLLSSARDVYASGGTYQTIYNEVVSALEEVQRRVDGEIENINDPARETFELINSRLTDINTVLADMKAGLGTINATIDTTQLDNLIKGLSSTTNITVEREDKEEIAKLSVDTIVKGSGTREYVVTSEGTIIDVSSGGGGFTASGGF